jgi:hypothetical protein
MNVANERTKSCWMDFRLPDYPTLDSNISADVVVVGSGVAGLSVAYELALRGDRWSSWIGAASAAG